MLEFEIKVYKCTIVFVIYVDFKTMVYNNVAITCTQSYARSLAMFNSRRKEDFFKVI